MLGDEELLKPPYSIENQAHRRAVLAELDRVKALGVKPPQNLWEYKVKTLYQNFNLQQSDCVFPLNTHFCHLPGGQCREVSVLAVRVEELPSSDPLLFVFIRLL